MSEVNYNETMIPVYNGFETVIGLEIHAQLATNSKLFSPAKIDVRSGPNRNISPVCTAQPGALPVLNRTAVEYAIRAGLALECTINTTSVFSRKNYFYPDLPKGYQISQFDLPICEHGKIEIDVEPDEAEPYRKQIGITRIHMEEDAGKNVHMAGYSLVDLNRAGTPLIEIVSEPDFRSPAEAVAYYKKIRAIVQYLEICDGNMQEGNLRCDANVSVRPKGQKEFGTRAEIKNVNSFRFLEKAIEYEIHRQIGVVQSGGKVVQETRLYDSAKNVTKSMRSKEEAHDYRYFPEPDLPPLVLDERWVDTIKENLPELPEAKAKRFVSTFGLPEYDAKILTSDKALAEYFENASKSADAKLVSNWIMGDVLHSLKESELDIEASPIAPAQLGRMVSLVMDGTISSKMAKDVFAEMWKTSDSPDTIIEAKGLKQVSDPAAIAKIVDDVVEANPKQLEQYLGGKDKLFGFFIGQAMKASKGKANPQTLNELMKKKLASLQK